MNQLVETNMPDLSPVYPARFPSLEELACSQLTISHLDGSHGTNRGDPSDCQLDANNDFQAMCIWLQEYRHKETTHRLYQKEAERLLLWSLFEKQKALSSLTRQDLEYYFIFLRNPTPQDIWCGKRGGRGCQRGTAKWRPFEGKLSDSSVRTTIAVMNSLFSYLEESLYLRFNPFRLMRKKLIPATARVEEYKLQLQSRILDTDEWEAMQLTLESMPENTPHEKDEKYRLKLIVAMLFLLGLRVGELVSHSWSAFRIIQGCWWFVVEGKGDKIAKIPVNDDLLNIVKNYRQHMLFDSELPGVNESIPIITSWHQSHAVSARYINVLLKKLALTTAEAFKDAPQSQEKLKRFSAHSLRHLSATMQDRVGISFAHIRSNLRHENDETTRLYVHGDELARHRAMSQLKWL